MHSKELFLGALTGFTVGLAYGVVLGTNRTMNLVSAAYGWPREEIQEQVEWYLSPIGEDR